MTLTRDEKLALVAARINDLETRLGGGLIDKRDEHAELSRMFRRLIEHECPEGEWLEFSRRNPKLRKYM